jgi:integrase
MRDLADINDMAAELARRKREPLLTDFFQEALTQVRATLEPGTGAIYATTFRHFIASAGNLPLRSVTARHIDRYKAERLQAVRPATVNIELRTLKAAFRIAVRWNMIVRSPLDGVTLVRVPERQPAYFTRDEFQRLLAAIKEQWLRDVVLFAAVTGMRQGEILSLRWDQIDFTRRIARVESNSSFRTKTGKRRSVPLCVTAMDVLRSRHGSQEGLTVFTLRGKALLRRWVTTKVRRYVRALGMDRRLNFHSLRTSFASWLALDGISIYQISKLLGHSDVKITQHYYAHLEPGELHGIVDKITFSCKQLPAPPPRPHT